MADLGSIVRRLRSLSGTGRWTGRCGQAGAALVLATGLAGLPACQPVGSGAVMTASMYADLGVVALGTLSAVAVACGSVLGDLVESMIKRQARVKDAGSWLPGFGGLLDRIDSLLLVLPLAYFLG